MSRITQPELRALVQRLAQDGQVDRRDVDQLIDVAMADRTLSLSERSELVDLLARHADKLDRPETRQRLEAFLAISDGKLREFAHKLERDDGVIDLDDAEKLLQLAGRSGSIDGDAKFSLRAVMLGSKLSDPARARLEQAAAGDAVPPVRVEERVFYNAQIPDDDPGGITSPMRLNQAGCVDDLRVEVDIEHSYRGDLEVSLVAPDGTEVLLHSRGGRGEDDLIGVYPGELEPAQSLDAFKGKTLAGEWRLKVSDHAGQDVGVLRGWRLSVDVRRDTPVDPPIDLDLPSVAGQAYKLSPDGHLVTGAGGPARFDEVGALTLYRGADALAQADGIALAEVPGAVKVKMLEHLERAFAAGEEHDVLPHLARLRMRSGAATTLLCLVEGCKADEAPLRQQAIDLYLSQAMEEPNAGLRSSMYSNLERLEGSLAASDKTRLAALREAVVPSKPPYEKWFADGKREIRAKHYAHLECWDHGGDPVKSYERKGYKVAQRFEDQEPKRWILEKTNDGAPGGPVKMEIELIQSHDGIFSSMDDPDVNMILYTGHSNLGGNVSEELRLGSEAKSEKLLLMAMCRGKQNMFEVANKYPHCEFVTTDKPSYFGSVNKMALAMVEGAINQLDYKSMVDKADWISDSGGKQNYFFPHEERRYALYDQDRDGVIDGRGSTVDRLFDVGLVMPPGTKVDCVPRPNDLVAEDLDGTKVQHAVQFLNTLMTYHVDHGNHTSAFKSADMDAFLSGGWFDGPTDELIRLEQVQVDGKPMTRIQVNKSLAEQSAFALGTLVQFEVCRQLLQERGGGVLTEKDEARAALFAGEYLAYMYCSWDEAVGSIRGVGRLCAHLRGLSFDKLRQAIDADGHGYVTDKQVDTLLELT